MQNRIGVHGTSQPDASGAPCAVALLAFAGVLFMHASSATAAMGGGTWTATDPGTFVPGSTAAYASLRTGEVLQVFNGSAAARYDPVMGVWSPAAAPPDMCSIANAVTSSSGATATALQNGQVILAGGAGFNATSDYSYLCSATDTFDPTTGMWTHTSGGPGRFDHDVTVLVDGRALYTGGMYYAQPGPIQATLNTSVFYWPGVGWIGAPAFDTIGRADHRTILLNDHDVLLTGGLTGNAMSGYTLLGTSFLYHPGTNTWSPTGSLNIARDAFGIAKLPDGGVLVSGGCCVQGAATRSAEIYDPATGVWSPTADMMVARSGHSLLTLDNGLVLAVGGESLARSTAEVFDASSNTWQAAGVLAGHHLNGTVALANGWALAPVDYRYTPVAEIYRPAFPHAKTDFNGDGISDIVFENANDVRHVDVMSAGGIASGVALPGASPGWRLAGIGDFNGDGHADLLWSNAADSRQYWIYLMNGTSVIGGGPVTVAQDYKPTFIADFNGDRESDILWEDGSSSRWIMFMNGTFVGGVARVPDASPGWQIVRVGDFNGDGDADLLWSNTMEPTQYWIYLLQRGGLVGGAGFTVSNGYQPTQVCDFNRDGKIDILWEGTSADRWAFVMNGAVVSGGIRLPDAAPGWSLVGVGDFDNMAGCDMLWQDTTQPSAYWVYFLNTSATVIGGGGFTESSGFLPISQ